MSGHDPARVIKKYYTIIPVRDCIGSIERTISGILSQSIPTEKICIVDDGSTDGTEDVLSRYQNEYPGSINIIRTNSASRDYGRIPSLINMCLDRKYDYHLIVGGDTILEPGYAETVLSGMERDPQIAIASGDYGRGIAREPQGAGRFVRQDFFFRFYDKYPEIVGHETAVCYKARANGYKLRVFNGARFEHVDQLGHGHRFIPWGYQKRALGYHPLFLLAMVLVEFLKNSNMGRRGACNMLWGYITFRPKENGHMRYFPESDRKEVRRVQMKHMRIKLAGLFKRTTPSDISY